MGQNDRMVNIFLRDLREFGNNMVTWLIAFGLVIWYLKDILGWVGL